VLPHRSFTPVRLLFAGAVVIASLLAAAPAHATRAHIDGSTLYLTGTGAGETFGVTKTGAPAGQWEIPSSSPIEAGPGCAIVNESAVLHLRCPSAGITTIAADAGGGNDVFTVYMSLNPAPGLVTAVMGDGNDTIHDQRPGGDSGFGLGPGNDRVVIFESQRLSGVLDIDGGPGIDDIDGGQGNDLLRGGDGDDTIEGEGGDDRINGGSGDDVIESDQGDDTVSGDEGNDVIGGGADNDDLTGGPGEDSVAADHRLEIVGSPFTYPLQFPAGDDRIYVDDGGEPDEVRCGDGNDFVAVDSEDHVPNQAELGACETIDAG
jgi:Ca2+-binding RTX toxin-like protein